MYLQPHDLARMVRDSQALGRPTAELAEAVRRMTFGYLQRHRYLTADLDHEDLVAESYMVVVRVLDRIDTSRNSSFAYLTACLANNCRNQARKARKERTVPLPEEL